MTPTYWNIRWKTYARINDERRRLAVIMGKKEEGIEKAQSDKSLDFETVRGILPYIDNAQKKSIRKSYRAALKNAEWKLKQVQFRVEGLRQGLVDLDYTREEGAAAALSIVDEML